MSRLPVLFIDLDDVLCLNMRFGGYDVIEAINDRHADADAVYREVFDARARAALKKVHDALGGRLHYVVSSTWRENFDREQIETVFRASGLGFVADALHDEWCTPPSAFRGPRVDNIAAWLDAWHGGGPIAILDDFYSGHSLEPALVTSVHPFYGRVVLCQENVGLLEEHVEQLVDALKRPLRTMF